MEFSILKFYDVMEKGYRSFYSSNGGSFLRSCITDVVMIQYRCLAVLSCMITTLYLY